MLLLYLEQAIAATRNDGLALTSDMLVEGIREDAVLRVRPKAMTASCRPASGRRSAPGLIRALPARYCRLRPICKRTRPPRCTVVACFEEYAMVFESRGSGRPFGVGPHAGELVADYRARLAHEHAEMQERRQAELAEQVSIRNMPSERIRIWERLHGLPLPRNPTHNLLSVIAAATDLQLEQVQEEQRMRRAAAKGTVAESAPIEPAT